MSVFQGARALSDGAKPTAPETGDLSALTVKQLRALCAERGIDAPSRATKTRLIELLGG